MAVNSIPDIIPGYPEGKKQALWSKKTATILDLIKSETQTKDWKLITKAADPFGQFQ